MHAVVSFGLFSVFDALLFIRSPISHSHFEHWRHTQSYSALLPPLLKASGLRPDALFAAVCWAHIHDDVSQQETLLPLTDRATRYVSQNLVNCRNKLYNNPQQIAMMELEGYSWLTCSKQSRLVDCRTDVVNKLECRRRRRRRELLTTRSTCRGEIFEVRSLGQSPKGKYLIFGRTYISL